MNRIQFEDVISHVMAAIVAVVVWVGYDHVGPRFALMAVAFLLTVNLFTVRAAAQGKTSENDSESAVLSKIHERLDQIEQTTRETHTLLSNQ